MLSKKFSWSGVIVVLLCIACMMYYYLIFRHTIGSLSTRNHAQIDK